MLRDLLRRGHERLRVLEAAAWHIRVYVAALVIALPDMLDALAGIDVSPLLPAWLPGAKFAAGLAVARLLVRAYARAIPAAAAPPAAGST
ncbi:hypothetical protein [Methylobacterium sp. JK268]